MTGPVLARHPGGPGRRAVLIAGTVAVAAVTGLLGCTGGPTPGSAVGSGPDAEADAEALRRTVQQARVLRTAAVTAGQDAIGADHAAHLVALGAELSPTAPPVPPSPSVSPGPTAGTQTDAAGLAELERDAAGQALAEVASVSAPVAVLLTEVAASRAGHADRLAGTTPFQDPAVAAPPAASPATSPVPIDDSPAAAAERDALARLVADTHAAVYGYGVVTARVPPGARAAATASWQAHRAMRDRATDALGRAGGRAPAASPGYDVGVVDGPSTAAGLAVRVENAMTTRLLATLAQVSPSLRTELATEVVATVRRAQAWGGQVPALPGA